MEEAPVPAVAQDGGAGAAPDEARDDSDSSGSDGAPRLPLLQQQRLLLEARARIMQEEGFGIVAAPPRRLTTPRRTFAERRAARASSGVCARRSDRHSGKRPRYGGILDDNGRFCDDGGGSDGGGGGGAGAGAGGGDYLVVERLMRSPRAGEAFHTASPDAHDPVCHWHRHKLSDNTRSGRGTAPARSLECALCGAHFCLGCVASRFTSIEGEEEMMRTWAAAGEHFLCWICTGECNCSAKGKHYFGRVAGRPTGSLAAERARAPTLTPNAIIIANPTSFPRHSPFPFEDPARFPYPLANQHHVGDLSPAQVRELKAGYPALVANYVAARASIGRPLDATEAGIVDEAPTLQGWSTSWGLSAPKEAARGAASAVELLAGAGAGAGAGALPTDLPPQA